MNRKSKTAWFKLETREEKVQRGVKRGERHTKLFNLPNHFIRRYVSGSEKRRTYCLISHLTLKRVAQFNRLRKTLRRERENEESIAC